MKFGARAWIDEAAFVVAEGVFGVGGEALREFGGGAELGGGEVREEEPVVPFAASLLQVFEVRGEVAGGGGGFRGGLGEVSGELGVLADAVKLSRILRDECGARGVLRVPLADEGGEPGFGEDDRGGGREGVEQLLKDERKLGAVLLEKLLEVGGFLFAFALERAAEFVCLFSDFGGGGRATVFACGFEGDEVALDVEIADAAGGATELPEQAQSFAGFLLVRREVWDHREEFEVGFDAPGGGAQTVDGGLLRIGEADQDRGFEGFSGLVEGFEGMRRLCCSRHGIWMRLPD
jgi:hypothetical protein